MNRFIQLEDISNVVAWIAIPECSYSKGFTFDVSGGRAVY